jgi:hypothetical protein
MKTLFYCIFSCLCAIFSTSSFGQFNFADSLKTNGNYSDAILEYERVLYTSVNDSIRNEAVLRKIDCYQQNKQYSEAYEEAGKIVLFNAGDQLNFCLYRKAMVAYLMQFYDESLTWLYQMDNDDHSSNLNDIVLLKILIYNRLNLWDSAYFQACRYIQFTHDNIRAQYLIGEINKIYKHQLPKLKTEKKLSYYQIVPFMGMFYLDNYSEGMLNLALDVAFLSFGVYQIYYKYYLTGYFTGAIGLNKFISGGRIRNTYLLEARNYNEMNKFDKRVKEILFLK